VLLPGHGPVKVAVIAKHVQGAVQRVYVVPDFRQSGADALGFVEQVHALGKQAGNGVLKCFGARRFQAIENGNSGLNPLQI
jgi:hypothetical protein